MLLPWPESEAFEISRLGEQLVDRGVGHLRRGKERDRGHASVPGFQCIHGATAERHPAHLATDLAGKDFHRRPHPSRDTNCKSDLAVEVSVAL